MCTCFAASKLISRLPGFLLSPFFSAWDVPAIPRIASSVFFPCAFTDIYLKVYIMAFSQVCCICMVWRSGGVYCSRLFSNVIACCASPGCLFSSCSVRVLFGKHGISSKGHMGVDGSKTVAMCRMYLLQVIPFFLLSHAASRKPCIRCILGHLRLRPTASA